MQVIILPYCYCFYEAKLFLRKFILLLFFSQATSLHYGSYKNHVEICRLLVESKADVAARDRCFSPPPSHHLSLTICLAAVAELHSKWQSTTKNPPWPHTCAVSARRNDAPPSCLLLFFFWGGEGRRRRRRRSTRSVAPRHNPPPIKCSRT